MKCRSSYVSVSPKLSDFSQYSSPLTPQFSAKAMNLFHNKQQKNKMSSQRPTPILNGYTLPSRPRTFSWSNNQ